MKTKTVYICESCGYQSSKWIGKCPQCDCWNTFREDVIAKNPTERTHRAIAGTPAKLQTIGRNILDGTRVSTNISEFDRVCGGGIVPGSLTLLAGEPGIGKSTLILQLCEEFSCQGRSVLYIAGEESVEQISLRAKRLGLKLENLRLISETNIETILATIAEEKPAFVIIDSIQIIYAEQIPSAPGSVTQVRTCAGSIMELIKKERISTFLIGHVTKDGTLAGPRALEHLVDTVLYLEGDRYQNFRILRGIKNRFGSTNEAGIFEMREEGMKEVKNPSGIFLSDNREPRVGSVVTVTMEGSRPILVEVQALTNPTNFGYPKRTASGFDFNRLNLLIAVIQKYTKLNLGQQDVYINVIGGIRIDDPACDLAVCVAIISSYKKEPITSDTVYIGEVGLSGEIRESTFSEKRKKIAKDLGYKKIISQNNTKKVSSLL